MGGRGEAFALVPAASGNKLGAGHHVHAVQEHRGRGRTKKWKKIVSLSEDQLDCCLGSLDGLARDETEAEKKVGAAEMIVLRVVSEEGFLCSTVVSASWLA